MGWSSGVGVEASNDNVSLLNCSRWIKFKSHEKRGVNLRLETLEDSFAIFFALELKSTVPFG